MKRVALYLSGVHDLSGGGGAERFFADFFSIYIKHKQRKFELFLFCDESTFKALQDVEKLKEVNNVVLLKNISNRFKKKLENIDFQRKLRKFKIDILHCANYGRQDFNRLDGLSGKKVIKVLNIVDCQVPYVLNDENDSRYSIYREQYVSQPQKIKFEGVFSWYEKFILFFKQQKYYPWNPIMFNIQSRFSDTRKFRPSLNKEKVIIFASRLHFQKRPDWFVKAVCQLSIEVPELIASWRFYLYGKGEMKVELIEMIRELHLENIIEVKELADLSSVYSDTLCYVSTQDYENFPSLSMMEAMSSANAVIARNVGQTHLMVKDGVSGILLKEDNVEGLVKAMKKYLEMEYCEQLKMGVEGEKMVKKIHTFDSFTHQIEAFWRALLLESE